ncbi:MAG TPA: linear amide C-N hydrolase [Candidatus Sulfotelmatobacter sp.]|nr:linear amide C-N hydrolase [Candidatus Sulfotelmatobacter sp.]
MKKALFLLLAAALTLPAFACSDFVVKAENGTVVNGRSMEFPIDLKSNIVIRPRGEYVQTVDSQGQPGISWTSKYGFLGINAFGLATCFVEGFNERGLAIGGLMFVGARYQNAVPGRSLPIDAISAWALGNFASVDEVKAALPSVAICDSSLKKLKDLGMHITFHDAAGKNLVVEFIGGQVNIYDNPLGVLTNRPEFPWQMNNLRNYVNLDARDKDERKLNGVKIEALGVGSGLLGLPGDWTPPSRFVRLAFGVDSALPPKDAAGAVNLAGHLLNMVDIPKGAIKENTDIPLYFQYGYAQWAVIKNLTDQVLYYRTYDNPAWRSVDLKKFDLAPGKPLRTIVMGT